MRAPGRFVHRMALVLAAGSLTACGSASETPPIDPQADAPLPVYRLDAVGLQDGAVRAEAVAFLPFVNRTHDRIHPAWLRAYDRALAAHAAVFDGHAVLDPDVAGVLGTALGFPAADTVGSDFTPDPTAMIARGRAAGAVTLVWGEIVADGRVLLHAAGAGAARWEGLAIELAGPRDVAYYEGPRQLLELLAGGSLGSEPPPPEAVAVLEAALAATASLDPAALSRSELAVARLAAAHPGWARPWIEIAWLRMLRLLAMTSNHHDFISEGPSAARHVARLFELSPADSARLDAIDEIYLWTNHSRAHRRAVSAALPAGAWERLLLTWPERPGPDEFGLAGLEARSIDERALLAEISALHDDAKFAAHEAIVADVDPATLVRSPYLLSGLLARAVSRNEWSDQLAVSRVRALHDGRAVLELLRGECAAVPAERRAGCQQPLSAALAAAGVPSGVDVADDSSWGGALESWFEASLERTTGSDLVALPNVTVFREDPAFVSLYVVPAELVSTTNAVLAAVQRARGGLADPALLLAAPVRARLDVAFDRLLHALHGPVIIQAYRADHRAARRYAVWGARFEGFPGVEFDQTWLGEQRNQREAAAAAYEKLGKADPYDGRWARAWLHYVDLRENISWDDSSSAREAQWLETLVPRTLFVTLRIAQAWSDAEQSERALAAIRDLEEAAGGPFQRVEQDDRLRALNRPRSERLARLEGAVGPGDTEGRQRLIGLWIEDRRYAEAEATARTLLDRPSLLWRTCIQLVDLVALQGRVEEGADVLADCASRAQGYNRFTAARLWGRLGAGLLDRDRFEEAQAAYEAGVRLIGGAADLVVGLGRVAEYSGRFDDARAQYEQAREHYAVEETMFAGRWELWQLHMRLDDPQAARAAIEKATLHAWGNAHAWDQLRRTYQMAGDLAGFEALVSGRAQEGPSYALARLRSRQGRTDEALELLDRIATKNPKQPFWRAYQAEVLIEGGRSAEAVERARQVHEADPADAWALGIYVDALIADGRAAEARHVARGFADRNRETWNNVLPLARVERALGRGGRAREIMNRSRAHAPWGRDPWSAECQWLPLEVSLGLPPPGSAALADLERRLTRALVRHPTEERLWRALAEVRERTGEVAGAAEAVGRAERLAGATPTPAPDVAKADPVAKVH